jgi:hypothetical protein
MFVKYSAVEFRVDSTCQIQELKSTIASEDMWDGGSDDDHDDVDVLLAVHHPPNLQELLCVLPPRLVVDRRLSVYFNAKWLTIRRSTSQRKW